MIPDRDIVHHIRYCDYGISMIIGRLLEFMIKDMERSIICKQSLMREVKPGSVIPNEPKVIWVKMLDRPFNSANHAITKKFNIILEDIVRDKKDVYILDPSTYIDKSMYS